MKILISPKVSILVQISLQHQVHLKTHSEIDGIYIISIFKWKLVDDQTDLDEIILFLSAIKIIKAQY